MKNLYQTAPKTGIKLYPNANAERDTEGLLAEVGSHCASVVICRASPSQKAAVVTMMTHWELRRAGGVGKGPAAWWRRKRFKLQVTPRAE